MTNNQLIFNWVHVILTIIVYSLSKNSTLNSTICSGHNLISQLQLIQDEMERKITSLEKAKLHYKESWTKALKELINGSRDLWTSIFTSSFPIQHFLACLKRDFDINWVLINISISSASHIYAKSTPLLLSSRASTTRCEEKITSRTESDGTCQTSLSLSRGPEGTR